MKKNNLSAMLSCSLIFCFAFNANAQWGTAGEVNTAPLTTGGSVGVGISVPTANLDVNSIGSDAYIKVTRTGTQASPFGTAGYKIGNTPVLSIASYPNYGSGTLNINNGTGMINLTGSQINFGGLPGVGVGAGTYNFNGLLWSKDLVVSGYNSPGPNPFQLPTGFKFAVNGNSYFNGVVGIAGVGGATWNAYTTPAGHTLGEGNLLLYKTNSVANAVRLSNNADLPLMDLRKHETGLGTKNVMLKLSNDYNGSIGAYNEPTILFDNGTNYSTYGGVGYFISAQVAANGVPQGMAPPDGSFRIGSYSNGVQTEHFKISNSGQVTIGINKPLTPTSLAADGKLFVNGKIYATAIQVKLSDANGYFPDYVFAPEYKLRSLKDVEKYVKENHHLPEVPSAKEVEEKGIDLAGMEVILLKKIEELTLYVIELQKQNNELAREVKQLK